MRNKIYTCGKMTGLSYEEQMKWRNEFKKYLCKYIDLYGYGNITRDIVIIAPPNYYYNDCKPSNQKEIQEWGINQVVDSDILLVNLDGLETSIGSLIEIGVAHGVNCSGNKHIYIVGIGELPDDIHPWIKNSFIHIEPNVKSAADYIAYYLLE